MAPHVRALLFCVSLLVAPALWSLGEWLGGEVAGVLLPAAVVTAAVIWVQVGERRPPAGGPAG
jgi:hypothetical protein